MQGGQVRWWAPPEKGRGCWSTVGVISSAPPAAASLVSIPVQGIRGIPRASMPATIKITSACSSEWLRLSSCSDLPAAGPLHAHNSRHAQIAALAILEGRQMSPSWI